MKKIYISTILLLVFLLAVSCAGDKEDVGIYDETTRVSLYPVPVEFNADGTTANGEDSYTAVVTIASGSTTKSDIDWTAEADSAGSWVTVTKTSVTSSFRDTYSDDIYETDEHGIDVKVSENTGYRRKFTVNVKVSDGTTVPFSFTQLGALADASVSSDTKDIEYMAVGGDYDIVYDTNMGEAYGFSVTYDEGSSDWLSWKSDGSGKVTLTASQWTNSESSRTATFTITVGTATTSEATLDITVTQLAMDKYYYMYGGAGNGLDIGSSIQMDKVSSGIYTAETYFMNTADGKNDINFNVGSRIAGYPYYALAKDGVVKKISSASDELPLGPVIDVDGLRLLTVDFDNLTWSWARVTNTNCLPDDELSSYPVKNYVNRDGKTRTWMAAGLHWNGGSSIGTYKLGSGLVPGTKTGGYTETTYSVRNSAYDTEENGGSLVESMMSDGITTVASQYGRLYTLDEAVGGMPEGALCPSKVRPYCLGEPGISYLDAVGNKIPIETLSAATLNTYAQTADGDAEIETKYPEVAAQIQGICPYGWHIASMQDWKDLIYSVYSLQEAAYPVNESEATYSGMATGTSSNVAAYLRAAEWLNNEYNPGASRATSADSFGFGMFPQGWRLYASGYDYGANATSNNCRYYALIPILGKTYSSTKTTQWRFYTKSSTTADMCLNDSFDIGNAAGAIRCVKNHKD
ncbi:MAG: hypothetical protein LKI42_04675 [Bacteroidales bacterium]|jgi:uncharacterized protein (TIGR02145 family)|nr:hypothetical protein [Bacteroidales bacterium]MCI1784810.1 hypothetical protein [Bacteroidales bacterium]